MTARRPEELTETRTRSLLGGRNRLTREQDFVQKILGAWLIVAPWVFGFSEFDVPRWTTVLIGAAVLLLAIEDGFWPSRYEEWANLALGLVLMLSPWIFDYGDPPEAVANAIVIGAVLVGWSGWALARLHDKSLFGRPGGPE